MLTKTLSAGLLALMSSVSLAGAGAAGDGVESLLSRFDETTPGLVVGLVRAGELVEAHATGMANLSFEVPFTAGTPTNIGSTAKQFTGLAVALLHERGELSLDDDIREYFPELPDFGETVTLRHLATHTSGYREFLNALALAGMRMDDRVEPEDAIDVVLRQTELQNPPGAEWNYNNTGYVLLGRVVAKVTGKPFEDWLAEEIFTPLGMRDTRVRGGPDRVLPGASTGYRKEGESWIEAGDLGGATGAGGVYTTVSDMARWMGQLALFELGGEAARALVTTPFELSNGESSGYGLGLILDEWRGLERWQHGGGDLGHSSVFNYFPEIDTGFVIFANHHDIGADFVHAVAEAWLGEHLEAREESGDTGANGAPAVDEQPFSDELFDRYAGRYELEIMPGFVLRFFRDGDRYMTQATGQPSVEMTPVAANAFSLVGVDARIEFHVEEDGSVSELTLFQNGEHRAVRLAEENGGEAIELGQFTGRYFSEELEAFYTIGVDQEGALFLRHRRLEPITLQHAEGDGFTGTFPVVTVNFERDEQGRVVALKAGNLRARDILFRRVD